MPNSPAGSHYEHIKSKWVQKHRDAQKKLWKNHEEHLQGLVESPKKFAAGSLAGILMLTQPIPATLLVQDAVQHTMSSDSKSQSSEVDTQTEMIQELKDLLPDTVQPLNDDQNEKIAEILTEKYGIKASPSYEGKRLNRTYGLIGQEQHLMRYPGDTMESHLGSQEERDKYFKYGMAPGRGAWGYFADSQGSMTEQDIEREKWYIAVPTFLSPRWKQDVQGHYKFYKYRKMLVVNPENGKAVVADIGDAGPAEWTGKHLGGSPEVMQHLERVDGRQRGPVLYFFIRDPQDKIPLGPIDTQ